MKAIFGAGLLCIASGGVAQSTQVTGFGSNPGALAMYKYVPSGMGANAPLVVALHGCVQSAGAYDGETGWVQLADRYKFALVLPEQSFSNNSARCFNWFETGDIARGSGETLSIKQMVDKMKVDHSIDNARVYVTGLSAGGAMASVMLATYPDVFAGGAIIAGVAFDCGRGSAAAFDCMDPGVNLSPSQWGNKVRAATSHTGPWPIVSIWHGSSDPTVKPVNAQELIDQWTNVHGIDQVADVEDTIAGYPHKVFRNAAGLAVVESYSITGMGHGTPVDPGSGPQQCGTAGAYILDANICSSAYIARFFGLDNADSVPPTVAITAPLSGIGVSGIVDIAAAAADNVGVARVEFLIDGALLGSDASAPYAFAWDTASASNGVRALRARAFDAAGNWATSSEVQVTVSGGIEDTQPPQVNLTFPSNGATVSGAITLAATASDDTAVSSVEFFVDGVSVGFGNQSGGAGPWTLAWNSTAVANGPHAIAATARDARGNQSTDNDTSITVNQATLAMDESFSNLDGNGDVYDQAGWSGDFVADADNATLGAGSSQSAYGYASSGVGCAGGWKTRFLQRSVTLSTAPRLAYARKLDLKAQINATTSARFRVLINNNIVHERVVTNANVTEGWQRFENIDLSSYANQTVTLRFEASANSNVCIEAFAKARIDDVRIANASASADSTPPSVNITAPVAGAALSGSVDILASASDNIGVSKVEFYANGSLLGQDLSAPYVFTWSTSDIANGNYSLMAKAFDAAGNVASDDDTAVSVANGGNAPITVSFASEGGNDGYIKANADGSSPAIGTLESSFGLALGRGSDGKFNRAVLSFDTSALPDGATITDAVLIVAYNSASGDPWGNPAGNTLVADIRNGCFGACTLEASDYGAIATATNVANIVKFSSGTQNASLSAAGLSAVSKTTRTQVRLRFTSNQTATSHVWIGSGATATLRITYMP